MVVLVKPVLLQRLKPLGFLFFIGLIFLPLTNCLLLFFLACSLFSDSGRGKLVSARVAYRDGNLYLMNLALCLEYLPF